MKLYEFIVRYLSKCSSLVLKDIIQSKMFSSALENYLYKLNYTHLFAEGFFRIVNLSEKNEIWSPGKGSIPYGSHCYYFLCTFSFLSPTSGGILFLPIIRVRT